MILFRFYTPRPHQSNFESQGNWLHLWRTLGAIVVFVVCGPLVVRAGVAPTRVWADADQIHIALTRDVSDGVDVEVLELPIYDNDTDWRAARIWSGRAVQDTVTVPRFADGYDRTNSRFFVRPIGQVELGPGLFVTSFEGNHVRRSPFPKPRSVVGVTNPIDLDDIKALGVSHVNMNVLLNDLYAGGHPGAVSGEVEAFEYAGRRFQINMDYIRGFDAQIKPMTDAGITVTLIILNRVRPAPADPVVAYELRNPATDVEGAPTSLGGFNLTSPAGVNRYRAAMAYLAQRYSRPDGRFGWVPNYIIGNEIQSHWVWCNYGRLPSAQVIGHYMRALRVADIAVKEQHKGIRVFISMDHSWAAPGVGDGDLVGIRGDELLLKLTDLSRSQGDFGWGVAHHPYPTDLFDPRFWMDRVAKLGYDTPTVTFKNLEVLTSFLDQPGLQFDGASRPIMLSEQGFNVSDVPNGEDIQAAAYAAALYRVKKLPQIEAFDLHRHADHPDEGGLRLGLWSTVVDKSAKLGYRMVHKRRIWDIVHTAAVSPKDLDKVTAFALPIIGIVSWSELDPASYVPDVAVLLDAKQDGSVWVYNLTDVAMKADVKGALDYRVQPFEKDGELLKSIYTHPRKGVALNATFEVPVPEIPKGYQLVFRFMTGLNADSDDGVIYSVRLDGRRIFKHDQLVRAAVEHEIVLPVTDGQKQISLTLVVAPKQNNTNDWAHWIEPKICIVGEPDSR